MNTPDPALNNPPVGQRILISWHIPKGNFNGQPPYRIKLTVRFCNRQECEQWYTLTTSWGVCIYSLVNQAFFDSTGIQTYKVELYQEERLLECWKHQLWVDLIILNPT